MAGRLAGQGALITGGGGGIGREAVLQFAPEGGEEGGGERYAAGGAESGAEVAQVSRAGGTAAFTAADVTVGSEVAAMIRFAEERFGALHVLFNNAGIFPDADGSVVDTDERVFDTVIAVNLKGVF